MALNGRQETFARLIALATMSNTEAAKQAGYSTRTAHATAGALLKNPSVASRVDSLRCQQRAAADAVACISRQRIVQELADMALVKGSSMIKLKAIELLAKMQGYNEPAAVQHSHVHLQVDAGLMEQLKAGHAALLEKQARPALVAPPPAPPGSGLPQHIKGTGGQAEGEGSKNNTAEKTDPASKFLHSTQADPAGSFPTS